MFYNWVDLCNIFKWNWQIIVCQQTLLCLCGLSLLLLRFCSLATCLRLYLNIFLQFTFKHSLFVIKNELFLWLEKLDTRMYANISQKGDLYCGILKTEQISLLLRQLKLVSLKGNFFYSLIEVSRFKRKRNWHLNFMKRLWYIFLFKQFIDWERLNVLLLPK